MWNDFEEEEEEMFEHGSKNARQIVKRFMNFLKNADDFFTESELEYLFSYFYYHKGGSDGYEKTIVEMGLDRYPHSGFFQSCRAKLYMDQDQHQKAIPFLQKSLILDPGNYDALLMLIDCYELEDEFQEALQLVQLHLDEDSDLFADLLIRKANLLFQTHQREAGLAALSQVIIEDIENEIHTLSIYITFDNQDVLDALELLINSDPYNHKTWAYKGYFLLELNATEKAVTAFEYAYYIDSNSDEYAAKTAECYKEMQDYHKAIEFYKYALKLTVDEDSIALPLAICYNRIQEFEQARQILQAYAFDEVPDYVIQYEMGYAYFFDNQPTKALPFLKLSAEESPNLDSLILLGECYLVLKQSEKIAPLFERALLLKQDYDFEYFITAFTGLAYRGLLIDLLEKIAKHCNKFILKDHIEISIILRDIVESLVFKLNEEHVAFEQMLMQCFSENKEETLDFLESIDLLLLDEPQIIIIRDLF